MSDKRIELEMSCADCKAVYWTSFIYDSACGGLIAEYSGGENCDDCGSQNISELED